MFGEEVFYERLFIWLPPAAMIHEIVIKPVLQRPIW